MLFTYQHAKKGVGNRDVKHIAVKNTQDTEVDFDLAFSQMDERIRAKLSLEMGACTEQEFFTAYEKAHAEKYGEGWELSKKESDIDVSEIMGFTDYF